MEAIPSPYDFPYDWYADQVADRFKRVRAYNCTFDKWEDVLSKYLGCMFYMANHKHEPDWPKRLERSFVGRSRRLFHGLHYEDSIKSAASEARSYFTK